MPPAGGVAQGAAGAPGRSPLTGERPLRGATPDSLLALHEAGYCAVAERLGEGRVLDVGCGEGLGAVHLAGAGRLLFGLDYDAGALAALRRAGGPLSGRLMAADAARLGVGSGRFDWVCSSHVAEHFAEPGEHLAELARVLAPGGTAFVLTPNAPADFENPFHLHPFVPASLRSALEAVFAEVWVGGLDASAAVKADFTRRRRRARRLLRLDPLGLRHRVPRSWYVAAYRRLLPLAYRLVARHDTGGRSGIGVDEFFVTEEVDETTPVLFAVARRPRAGGG